MGGVFFFLLLVCGVSLEAWRKGRSRTVKFVVCMRHGEDGLSEATGISSPPMNPVDGRGFCPEFWDWRTQRQGLEPPTAESHREPGAVGDVMGTVIFRSEETTQPGRVSTILTEDLNSAPALKLTTTCNFRLQGNLTPSSTFTCTHLTTAYMHTIKNKIFKKLHVCTLAEDPCSVLSTHTWQL